MQLICLLIYLERPFRWLFADSVRVRRGGGEDMLVEWPEHRTGCD
jgi:hypothetical protein